MDVETIQPAPVPLGASSGARMVRDSALTMGTRIFQYLVIFVKQAILAKALGPENRGIYQLVITTYDLLISYGRLGVNEAIVYHAGRRTGRSLEEIAGNVLTLAMLTGTVMAGATLLVSGFLLRTVLEGVPLAPLVLMVAMLPFGMVQIYFASLLQSQRRLVSFNVVNAIVSLTHLAAMIVALLVLRAGVMGAVIATMISVLLPMVVAVAYATRNLKLRPQWSWAIVKDLITFGLKSHLNFVLNATILQIDLLVMNPLLSVKAVGIYAVANNLVGRTVQMPTAVSNALYPHMVASGSDEQTDVITERAARNLLTLVAGIAVGAAAAGYIFIYYVLGGEFRAAFVPFLILLIGVVPQGSVQIFIRNFSSRGRPLLAAIPTGLALLVNFTGDVLLIPRIGMIGAAISSATGGLVMFATGVALYAYLSKRPWWNAVFIRREDFGAYRQLAGKVRQRASRWRSRGGYPPQPPAIEGAKVENK